MQLTGIIKFRQLMQIPGLDNEILTWPNPNLITERHFALALNLNINHLMYETMDNFVIFL